MLCLESSAQVNMLAHSANPNATTQDAGDAATLIAANAHSDAGDATTLAAANAFTSTSSAATLSSANSFTTNAVNALATSVDDEFAIQDRRISRVGAMGAAFSGMAMNTAGLSGENRVGVGFGNLSGQQAFSVGFQHGFNNNRASISMNEVVSPMASKQSSMRGWVQLVRHRPAWRGSAGAG